MAPGTLSSQVQSFLTVQPIDTLMVHLLAFTAQQNVNPFVTIAYSGCSYLLNPKAEYGLIIGLGLVAIERAMDLQDSTGPAFTCIVVHLQVVYQLTAMIRP